MFYHRKYIKTESCQIPYMIMKQDQKRYRDKDILKKQ